MKRFHVHLGVADLEQNIRFYSGLFGAPPTVRKDDYAKWMIDDPRVNFAISARGGDIGVNHLGLQAESADELAVVREQFAAADQASLRDEPGAKCCYAQSDKHWVTDPQGIAWEGYHTLGEVRYFDGDGAVGAAESACCMPAHATTELPKTPCCTPAAETATPCCAPAAAKSPSKAAARCCG
jgi:catechol 2,3-dioxygenase-like lactoylglutathione lyase family enzyme